MVNLKKASSKRIKPSVNGIDRISNLPEPLISKILSLLPTENAVATSALSRRWKLLWTSVTTLNLVQGYPKKSVNIKAKFVAFVYRVFMLITPSCIHKFRLNCIHQFFDPIHLQMWISVMAHTVRELDLYLVLNQTTFDLELNHFRFNKLVSLKLKGDINFKIPSQASVCFPNLQTLHLSEIKFAIAIDSSVSFPNLTSLHFYYVIYDNEESFYKLFSSCPILQELYISRHSISTITSLNIHTPSYLTSPQLVVLKLDGRDIDFKIPAKTFLCFPNLQQLHLSDIKFDIAEDSSVSFPKLKILYVDFYVGLRTNGESVQKLISSCPVLHNLYISIENWKDLPRLFIHIPSLTKLQLKLKPQFNCWSAPRDQPFEIQIDDLHKLQFLSISSNALKVIDNGFSDFYNLKRLEVDVDNCLDLSLVIDNLLECMDNLEHLAIRMNYRSCSYAHRSWSQPLNVPKGLERSVTTISFDEISGDCRYQLGFLRYILENAKVLQVLKLSIQRPYSSDERKHLLEKVSKFPKESQACQVTFLHSWNF